MRRAALLLLAGQAVTAVTQVNLRGLAPETAEQVKRFSSLTCDGASRDVPVARFNDDYCDCADGADEPGAHQAAGRRHPGGAPHSPPRLAGTSACANGRFHCENVGHAPQYLFSSRVNDGFCGAGAPLLRACCFLPPFPRSFLVSHPVALPAPRLLGLRLL